jgi:hypothetical protein
MALRTIKANAEQKNKPVFLHFEKPTQENSQKDAINIDLNKVMQNVGSPQFTYETFKKIFENNDQIQNLVDNFNSIGIKINFEKDSKTAASGKDTGNDAVEKMAKQATDLG